MQLDTERLKIRHLETSDAPFILELLNTPGWLTYIGDRKVRTAGNAQTYIQNISSTYAAQPLALSRVSLRKTNQPIGICGFLKRDFLPGPDIGYALLPDFEGQGYATEMVQNMLSAMHTETDATSIFAMVKPTNQRSIQLLSKLGFHRLAEHYDQEDTIVYQLEMKSASRSRY